MINVESVTEIVSSRPIKYRCAICSYRPSEITLTVFTSTSAGKTVDVDVCLQCKKRIIEHITAKLIYSITSRLFPSTGDQASFKFDS
jgi:hypothetical protein